MRLKLIACKSMARELSYLSALSPNILDLTWVRQGYHDSPDLLRKMIQEEIDSVESGNDPHTNAFSGEGPLGEFDAILIGYGLCSNAIAGLHSRRFPLVIPRGHDCITMLLGSKERYREYFGKMPDCFWYTASWIENGGMPCEETSRREREQYREQGYDEEDIDFLMETLHGWTENYHHAAYIQMPFFDNPAYQEFTRKTAEYFHWNFDRIDGDLSLLRDFVNGDWDREKFLLVPPGCRVIPSNDESIIGCEKISSET